MNHVKLIFLALTGFFLFGCSTLPITYSPSTTVSGGQGTVSVGKFNYLPAKEGRVEANEVEKNPASIGTVYLSTDIETLLSDAFQKELRFAGYKISSTSPVLISGDVEQFYHNWVGFLTTSVDFRIKIYVTKEGATKFTSVYSSHKEAPKASGYETEAMKSAIGECITKFLIEAEQKQSLN